MDLFELFGSVEELEENVKGVPEFGEEQEEPEMSGQKERAEELPWQDTGESLRECGSPVMQRTFRKQEQKESATIAYLDYNRVYLKDWETAPVIYQFDGTKDAVDFYVEKMQHFLSDKKVKVQKEPEELKEASVRKWTGERKA